MKNVLLAALAAVALAAPVRADDLAFSSSDDVVSKHPDAALVVFGKEDSDEAKATLKHLADKRFAKAFKAGLLVTRLDPGDDEGAKKLGLPAAEKNPSVVSLDAFGVAAGKHEKTVTADSLAKLVKEAEDATAKKKKIQKTLDKAVLQGEAAMKKDDTKTACEQFLAVVNYKATVPCEATEKAQKHLDELNDKGQALLTQARTATGKEDFGNAQKLINQATNNYPLPEVQAEAKKVKDELAQEMNRAQGK